jgi:hypothetical protein
MNPSKEEVTVGLKLDKEDYYEGEAVTGHVRLKLARDLKDFQIRLELKYLEHYVLFNETGDTAL